MIFLSEINERREPAWILFQRNSLAVFKFVWTEFLRSSPEIIWKDTLPGSRAWCTILNIQQWYGNANFCCYKFVKISNLTLLANISRTCVAPQWFLVVPLAPFLFLPSYSLPITPLPTPSLFVPRDSFMLSTILNFSTSLYLELTNYAKSSPRE